jgi:DNA-binding response OmpR family regulator
MVLLVEDSAEIRTGLRDMLRTDGHAVIEATTASEARALVAELPEITAILSDIVLEGDETGLDLVHSLSDISCPVVFMTSLPLSDPRHDAARAVAPVLRKPISPEQLRACLMRKDDTT